MNNWVYAMLRRGIHDYLQVAFTLAAITCAHRFLILDLDVSNNFGAIYSDATSKAELYQLWWQQSHAAIMTGIASDIVFVLIVSLFAFVIRPRWAVLPLAVLCLFYAANVEHLHYNFSHIRLGTLSMALDPTFIAGSATTPEFLLNLFMIAATGLVFYRVAGSAVGRYCAGFAVVIMLGLVAVLPRGMNPLDPGWMQTHPLALLTPADQLDESTGAFAVDALDSSIIAAQTPSAAPHNILVVYLEGVSQHSVATGDMPFLQELAADNLSFSRFFGNQLQTSNGLYTSLTGYYPNFLGAASPWDTLTAEDPAVQTALPTLLIQQGYSTAFLQSADLGFMDKAKHLDQLGFQDVRGREAWTDFRSQNGWGIDDLSLFEATLGYIDTLSTERPWFVSVLTSGTHAPYNVPADFLPSEPARLRALKYADAAAWAMMEGLRARGMLDNTIVIFTADESREPGGKSNLENEILLNWLPLIVAHPNGQSDTIDWTLGATKFPDLVLRLAGQWTVGDIDDLNEPDAPLIFGNFYKSRVFWFDRLNGDFYACFTQTFLCAKFTDIADLTQLAGRAPETVSHEPQMQAIFRTHEAGRSPEIADKPE